MKQEANRSGAGSTGQGQRPQDTTRGGGYERGGHEGGAQRPGGQQGTGPQSGNQPNRGQQSTGQQSGNQPDRRQPGSQGATGQHRSEPGGDRNRRRNEDEELDRPGFGGQSNADEDA